MHTPLNPALGTQRPAGPLNVRLACCSECVPGQPGLTEKPCLEKTKPKEQQKTYEKGLQCNSIGFSLDCSVEFGEGKCCLGAEFQVVALWLTPSLCPAQAVGK